MFYLIRLISFLFNSNNSDKSENVSSLFISSIFYFILYKISFALFLPVSYNNSFFNNVLTLTKYSIYSAIKIISFCIIID